MRISDWSSDVCSSDLRFLRRAGTVTMTQECCSPSHSTSKPSALKAATMRSAEPLPWLKYTLSSVTSRLLQPVLLTMADLPSSAQRSAPPWPPKLDRKRVVSGKRVSVRVDLGGRRNIKKKTKK